MSEVNYKGRIIRISIREDSGKWHPEGQVHWDMSAGAHHVHKIVAQSAVGFSTKEQAEAWVLKSAQSFIDRLN